MRYIKITIVVIVVGLFIWLLNQRFIFTPSVTYTYRAGHAPGAVRPDVRRIIRTYNSPWRFDNDTVNVDVRIPRAVEHIRFRTTLRNINQPIIRLRAKGNDDFGDQVRLVRHYALDELDWHTTSNQLLHLWQRPTRPITQSTIGPDGQIRLEEVGEKPVAAYASIDDFFSNLPEANRFAVADLDPMVFSFVSNYKPALTPITIPHAFRGSHTLYVYVANEDLRLTFDKVDLNRKAGPDELRVIVRKISLDPNERTLVHEIISRDDGNIEANNVHGQPSRVEIIVPELITGMYKIEIQTTEDVVFRNLLSYQEYLVFLDRVFLSDSPSQGGPEFRPVKISGYTQTYTAETKHPEGLQVLRVGGQTIPIEKVGEPVEIKDLPSINTLEIERGDLIVEGKGMFTLAPAKLPEQVPTSLIEMNTVSLESYDYIIGRYFPKPSGERVFIDEKFPLRRLLLTTNDIHFQLEMPELRLNRRIVEFRTIRISLYRGEFPWNKLPEKINKLFNRKNTQ